MENKPNTLAEFAIDPKKTLRQCKRCFMTGKACIYQRPIHEALTKSSKAFMLMPFRSTLDEVYQAQIGPCLKSALTEVKRADDVTKTGYVVCEKICRQIQESHLVSAEVSADNANVFYELGLAYALGRPIALFMQRGVTPTREAIIRGLGLGDKYNAYDPFNLLRKEEIRLWHTPDQTLGGSDNVFVLLADSAPFYETVNDQRFTYTIDGLCRGAIHRALDRLFDSLQFPIRPARVTMTLKDGHYRQDSEERTFETVESEIRSSSCVIICTSLSEPASFFWLGFAHGLEKDAVPITVLAPDTDSVITGLESRVQSDHASAGDLPFDMRALWHIRFPCSRPAVLEHEVNTILEIIYTKDKESYWRRQFWQPILDEGKVSVFVGSVELTENKRHVVGEWDYRTVSELTSFLASMKETMEIVIQTPTFQASATVKGDEEKLARYKESLKSELDRGNSIIIASADVNDMTEMALATYAKVEPFGSKSWKHASFNGIVAFKTAGEFSTDSVYFQKTPEPGNKRGFYDVQGGYTHEDRTWASEHHKHDSPSAEGFSVYYGHIAKMLLPNGKWSLVVQGITGPATLGVVQVLSGGIHRQFTVFSDAVSTEKREAILNNIAGQSDSLRAYLSKLDASPSHEWLVDHSEALTQQMVEFTDKGAKSSVEVIIKVFIADGSDLYHDERSIAWWDIVREPREMPVPRLRK